MVEKPHAIWIRFGAEAKRMRTNAGVSQDQLSKTLRVSPALLSAIERGTRTAKRHHAEALDAALNTGGSLTRLWVNLSNQQDVPDWFRDVVVLERQAAEIREYQSILVPGLLQAEEYARAVIRSSRPWDDVEQVERSVESRMNRREVITRTGRPLLWFVLDEITIRRIVGSQEIMHDQLEHLRKLAEDGVVRLQVVPLSTLNHPGLCSPFRLMSFDDRPSVAYAERLKGGELIDATDQVRECNTIFGSLQAEALSPSASVEMVCKVQGELQ
ncbi:transcriptional regulator with XRE-family HTH domain [Spinactinospora alkalitolerans]|uniref:Transcriptional regulator with XRE-family HTH domain n=1 Tax=Spinactinospora alkalitolerans TaxID=687207 RepID=A0A852U4I8_9ACTN|nr:helix-turn-helix transcriptional regulator [Spinactinospora alkalitolerans]NYE49004.1 transcriptional regulator with XRE-family HTH domain [Spinactinospora alkalitolerans]